MAQLALVIVSKHKIRVGWQNLVVIGCAETENHIGAPRTELLANAMILYKFHCSSNITCFVGFFLLIHVTSVCCVFLSY